MEQKMAPGEGLTARQKQLLDLAVREPYFINTFYLSGGTALSSWYLHHRESYDLDFFSLIGFEYEKIIRWFRYNEGHLGYSSSNFDEDYGFLRIVLRYPDEEILNIDFNHYSESKISKGIKWHGLEIDSLIDITANKIITISSLPRTRDYIDLYFILKETKWDFDKLIVKASVKFRNKIDYLQLSKNFLKSFEYTDFPIMLMKFDENDLYTFFENLSKKMKSKIFK